MSEYQPFEEICLAALGVNQAAVKQVDHALREVVKNISDPNTDSESVRSVTLKIKLKPSKDRRSAEITFQTDAKLAGDMPGSDHVVISPNGRGAISMAEQLDLMSPSLTARDGGES
jgi:hypothetical protein